MTSLVEINVGLEEGSPAWQIESTKAVEALEKDGAISVYGHGVDEQLRTALVQMMRHIFAASSDVQDNWVFPDKHYQVGLTPADTERHRLHPLAKFFRGVNRPFTNENGKDVHKLRWFEPLGPKKLLPYSPITPRFPKFRQTLLAWGEALAYGVVKNSLARMIAFGYGLPMDYFDQALGNGVHLIAPTGTNLVSLLPKLKEKEVEFIKLAGFHNDLNWGTIHGRASLPGLWIWTTAGQKMLVRIKEGHLLFQVGQQLAAQTAYRMKAGFHEVVITAELVDEIVALIGDQSFPWRIGSTVFVTADRELLLMPHDKLFEGLDRDELIEANPHLSMTVAEQMHSEFERIAFA